MKIDLEKDSYRECNFCDNDLSKSTPLFGFIRDKGNSLYATMCDNCLRQLIEFRKQYLESIF